MREQSQIGIEIPQAAISSFCHRHHIQRLALFGSVLRSDFRSDSDVDVLVEFDTAYVPGLIRLGGMELELSKILGGGKVDLNTPHSLSQYFKAEVLAEAQDIYLEKVVAA
jgi:hypothetical protein